MTAATANFSEERLRARIALAWSHFETGDFESYVSMWTAQNRQSFRQSEEDWQKSLRMWESLLRAKPIFELLDLKISGLRARVKVRISMLERGSRVFVTDYEHWAFEHEDWFLEDTGRRE